MKVYFSIKLNLISNTDDHISWLGGDKPNGEGQM